MESQEIYDQVNKRYGSIAKSSTGEYEQRVAQAFGYTEEELASIPEGANLGVSCGNPIALAKLKEGDTVIDLGSGAGFDVFTAAIRVGPRGKAIGVDMNKIMNEKANTNKARANASNVEFIESAITSIALPDNIADCIISNCVINLVPAEEKQLAFNEMFRLLKPGGRVAISDILARKEFSDEIRKNIALYVGCIAGASQVGEYEAYLRNAGFQDILIVDSKNDLNVYFTAAESGQYCCGTEVARDDEQKKEQMLSFCNTEEEQTCCQPGDQRQNDTGSMANEAKSLAAGLGVTEFNEWAGSFQVYAVKS